MVAGARPEPSTAGVRAALSAQVSGGGTPLIGAGGGEIDCPSRVPRTWGDSGAVSRSTRGPPRRCLLVCAVVVPPSGARSWGAGGERVEVRYGGKTKNYMPDVP